MAADIASQDLVRLIWHETQLVLDKVDVLAQLYLTLILQVTVLDCIHELVI